MKQLNSLYNSNAQELLGRITLSGKNILNRSAYILVTNEQNMPKGYKAIISTHDFSANTSTPYIKVDNISDFNEGDVINISPNEGTEKVPFFYDQNGKCLRFVTSLSANRLK